MCFLNTNLSFYVKYASCLIFCICTRKIVIDRHLSMQNIACYRLQCVNLKNGIWLKCFYEIQMFNLTRRKSFCLILNIDLFHLPECTLDLLSIPSKYHWASSQSSSCPLLYSFTSILRMPCVHQKRKQSALILQPQLKSGGVV